MVIRCVNCGQTLEDAGDTSECLTPPEPHMTVAADGPWFHTPEQVRMGPTTNGQTTIIPNYRA